MLKYEHVMLTFVCALTSHNKKVIRDSHALPRAVLKIAYGSIYEIRPSSS